MKEIFDNLWNLKGTRGITTNGFVKSNGQCVMGRGCAREAAEQFPRLPKQLGDMIGIHGNRVFYFREYDLFSFPVKHKWWEAADLELIKRSAREVVGLHLDVDGPLYLPRPGCGNGKLRWSDVKPAIAEIFANTNIYIVSYLRNGEAVSQ